MFKKTKKKKNNNKKLITEWKISKEMLSLIIRNNLTATDKVHRNLLMYVCSDRNIKQGILNSLLQNGVNSNIIDIYGDHALNYLCQNKSITPKLLNILLSKCNLINKQDKEGNTPSLILCQNKNINLELLQILINNGANLNIYCNRSNTVLINLCENESITSELLKLLLKNSLSINHINKYFDSALTRLCENRSISYKMLNMLFKAGANTKIRSNKRKLLNIMCSNPSITPKLLKLLIKKGLRVDTSHGPYYCTPLMTLCENPSVSPELLNILIDNGANVNRTNLHINDINAFMILCKNKAVSNELVMIFIRNGININATDVENNTALLNLCKNKKDITKSIYTLLKHDVEIKFTNIDLYKNNINLKNRLKRLIEKKYKVFKNAIYEDFVKFFDSLILELSDKIKDIDKIEKGIEMLGIYYEFLKSGNISYDDFVIKNVICNAFHKFILKHNLENLELTILRLFTKIYFISDYKDYLKSLWYDEGSKDFSIICNDGEIIKVHKFVLIARSKVYCNMFKSINDNDKLIKIEDFSERSSITLKIFYKYLYYDEFIKSDFGNEKKRKKLTKELIDLNYYFDLNENSLYKYDLMFLCDK
jgi:hypothetical protein